MRIEDSVFLITGGGSGLGLAAARQLLGQGGKVLLLDINAEAGQRAAAELGEGARFVQADITREEDGRVAVAQALEAFGERWDSQYPQISRSWQSHWDNLITIFEYPPAIRKVIYTTNAIESLNSVIRKAIKKR